MQIAAHYLSVGPGKWVKAIIYLFPMSFGEFIEASGEKELHKYSLESFIRKNK
jgi:hypothetical protein